MIVSTAAFAVATAGTGIATYAISTATIRDIVDRRLLETSRFVTSGRSVPEIIHHIDEMSGERDTGDIGFVLLDKRGRKIFGTIEIDRQLPLGFSKVTSADGIPGLSEGRALVRQVGDIRLVTVAETEPFDHYNAMRARIYLFGFGSIALTVLVGLLAFAWAVKARIGETRAIAEAIIDGDMARRVPLDGSNDEFDKQARTFNRMLDRIEDLMAGLENVSNDVAHDLRTPLARLRSHLNVLLSDVRAAPIEAELEAAVDQSDELLRLFNAILRIAEIEGGSQRSGFVALDLGEIAGQVVETMQAVAEDQDHSLYLDGMEPVSVMGDRHILAQILFNLFENAIRHTPPGTEIRMAVVRDGASAVITVSDNGPGIPADRRREAMRRFGRLDTARRGSGHGLGLALVEAAMRLHGGEVQLDDARPGLCVRLRLPAKPDIAQ